MHASIQRKRGFTLIEVIIALTITAGACTAVAMLLYAVTTTWHTGDGISEAVNSARNGLLRITSYIKESRFIGFSDTNNLLLWSRDQDGDARPDYCEMVLIRYQSADKKIELVDIYFPPGTPQADIDSRKTNLATANIQDTSVITTMSTDSYARTRTLTEDVDQFSITLDNPPPSARLATITLKISRQGMSQYFQTVAAPRSIADYLQ